MKKVKAFNSDTPHLIERQINAWFEENPDINLIDIKFSSHGYHSAYSSYDRYSALIIYSI